MVFETREEATGSVINRHGEGGLGGSMAGERVGWFGFEKRPSRDGGHGNGGWRERERERVGWLVW